MMIKNGNVLKSNYTYLQKNIYKIFTEFFYYQFSDVKITKKLFNIMKKTQLIFAGIASLLFSNALFSQEKPKEWDVSLYGFARADYIFDSRQSAQVREYHLNLYPLDKKLDANGDDINATGASNFYQ